MRKQDNDGDPETKTGSPAGSLCYRTSNGTSDSTDFSVCEQSFTANEFWCACEFRFVRVCVYVCVHVCACVCGFSDNTVHIPVQSFIFLFNLYLTRQNHLRTNSYFQRWPGKKQKLFEGEGKGAME